MASGDAINMESNQMSRIVTLARDLVEQNSRGLQMAYQRSIEMQVSVSTETPTEMVWIGSGAHDAGKR